MPLELPCGQCMSCRLAKARDWAIRCVHEAQMHDRSSFLTLTYAPEFLPVDVGLDVSHWQLFAKRMRKRLGPFRFFHCGEYGDENQRPHYHACVFGQDFSEDRYALSAQAGSPLFRSPTWEALWTFGFSTIGAVSFDSAAYVARYCMKKVTGPPADEHYQRVDAETGEVWNVKPEYVTMSRRPGLGASWFAKYFRDVYPEDVVIVGGKKFRPPKYYDGMIERADPKLLEVLKARRRSIALGDGVDSDERRFIREKCVEARVSSKVRDVV